jgi:cytochrome b pre-mRNA-processing protein 3
MIWPFRRRQIRPATISTLYGMIVAQARLPCFYRDYGVADTVNGRFDLIVLHLTILLRRLASEPALRTLGQSVFDRFCRDMDHNLREMGVGDLKIPKEMRRIGDVFYGCSQAYGAALDAHDDAALAGAIARNVAGAAEAGVAPVARLAAYMREAIGDLMAQDSVALAEGRLRFPDPAMVPMIAG